MIALIDYENIGSLEGVSLTRYERVVLFTGPQQEYILFPARTLGGDISLQVIQVPAISKNNVDFHLVPELGGWALSRSRERYCMLYPTTKAMTALLADCAGADGSARE